MKPFEDSLGIICIETKEDDKAYSTKQLRFIYDTAIHATIGKMNHDEEFNRVIKFINDCKLKNPPKT